MNNLKKYNAAILAIKEARDVDEVKSFRDRSDAMRVYAMQSKNKELEINAAEIRIRAERRLGELIIEQKQTVGLNSGRAGLSPIAVDSDDRDSRPKLSDAGISKDLSSRSQKLAKIDNNEFEAGISEWREKSLNGRVTVDFLNKPKHEDAQEFSKADELMCELEALRDAFKDLEIKIATQNYDGVEPLPVIVDELRIELKHTKIELEAITQTRDTLLNENAQLKRQLKIVQSKVKNG